MKSMMKLWVVVLVGFVWFGRECDCVDEVQEDAMKRESTEETGSRDGFVVALSQLEMMYLV